MKTLINFYNWRWSLNNSNSTNVSTQRLYLWKVLLWLSSTLMWFTCFICATNETNIWLAGEEVQNSENGQTWSVSWHMTCTGSEGWMWNSSFSSKRDLQTARCFQNAEPETNLNTIQHFCVSLILNEDNKPFLMWRSFVKFLALCCGLLGTLIPSFSLWDAAKGCLETYSSIPLWSNGFGDFPGCNNKF